MKMILRSVQFAAEKQQKQRRSGGNDVPYINHPIQVARLVAEGNGSEETICAAFLHDVIEDCSVADQEILDLFPEDPVFASKVLGIVREVTDPVEKMPYSEIKALEIVKMKNGYSSEAKILKIADQTCNMRDLVANPPKWGNGEEEEYIVLMKKLVDHGVGTNLMIESLFDSAYQNACKFYQLST